MVKRTRPVVIWGDIPEDKRRYEPLRGPRYKCQAACIPFHPPPDFDQLYHRCQGFPVRKGELFCQIHGGEKAGRKEYISVRMRRELVRIQYPWAAADPMSQML